MALSDDELAEIKAELGFNLLAVGAEPYIGITAIFSQVIQPYLTDGVSTTSSTSVTATTEATPTTLTLASGTGFASRQRVVVDVDARREVVTAQHVSGTSLTALFVKPHSGTYPVALYNGEEIVRDKLFAIRAVKAQMAEVHGHGAIKKVDEIEFYQAGGATAFGVLGSNLATWRNELAAALGIRSLWGARSAGAQRCAVY